jgi:hypothetical protein
MIQAFCGKTIDLDEIMDCSLNQLSPDEQSRGMELALGPGEPASG